MSDGVPLFLFVKSCLLVNNNTNQNKNITAMSLSNKTDIEREMKNACWEGDHEVVKNILSSHPESINFSYEVWNFFFFFFFSLFFNISF